MCNSTELKSCTFSLIWRIQLIKQRTDLVRLDVSRTNRFRLASSVICNRQFRHTKSSGVYGIRTCIKNIYVCVPYIYIERESTWSEKVIGDCRCEDPVKCKQEEKERWERAHQKRREITLCQKWASLPPIIRRRLLSVK